MPKRINDEREDAQLAPARPKAVTVHLPQSERRTSSLVVVAVIAMAVVLAFVAWPKGGEASSASPTPQPPTVAPSATPTSTATPTPTEVPPTPTPSGPDIRPYTALIEAHMAKGEYQAATTTAEGVLAVSGLTAEQRRIITGYIVIAGMKEIENAPFEPLDQLQHQTLVDKYLSLRERAKDTGLTLDSPLEVARRAHTASQFPLARVAIEEALKDGLFNPAADRAVTRLYASALYGMGTWYATAPKDSPLYAEGIRWLVTSDAIADYHKTGQSEAEVRLSRLGYTYRLQWPPRFDTPLLP